MPTSGQNVTVVVGPCPQDEIDGCTSVTDLGVKVCDSKYHSKH